MVVPSSKWPLSLINLSWHWSAQPTLTLIYRPTWSLDGSPSPPTWDHLGLGISPNISPSTSHQRSLGLGISPRSSPWSLIKVLYSWHAIWVTSLGISPRVSRSWHLTKILNLGLSPRISTSWHIANGHYSSPRVSLLASHQESLPLGISPRVSGSQHLTKILNLASHQVTFT